MSKKWASDKGQMKMWENWRKYANEDSGNLLKEEAISGFDPSEFPNPLPADQTKSFMQKGWDDTPDDGEVDSKRTDDMVDVELGASVSANSLMPSQTAVFLGKALGMSMVPKLSSGGDIGAVISEDNHILDGHHRWAATHLRTGGTADIVGTKVMLPITQLIPVLRATGDAYGNARKGEPAGGDLNMFSDEAKNPEVIREMVETGKYMNPSFYNREKLEAHVESIGGIDAIVEAVGRMQAAASKAYGGSGLGNAPPRKEMPVLEPKKGQVKNAASRLQKGTIDVAPPYGDLEAGPAAHGGEDIKTRKKRMSKVVSENSKRKLK
tara:strand:- start:365 stop:1333 length:969 start_codon:yes stop_codon:yes gene_type:complete